jgi:hypothetical protein
MPTAATREEYEKVTREAAPSYRSERLAQIDHDSAVEVNVRLPMGIHPAMLDALGPALVDGESAGLTADAYSSARHALKNMYEALGQIDAAVAATLITRPIPGQQINSGSKQKLERVVDPTRAAELASAADAAAQRSSAIVQRGVDKIDQTLAKFNDWIEAKTVHPKANVASVVQEASEIRAYVKALDPKTRTHWVEQRIEAGEQSVAFAVINASPWISGLEPEQQQVLRDLAEQKFAPVEYRRRAALSTVKTSLQSATFAFANAFLKLRPTPAQTSGRPGQQEIDALKGKRSDA